MLVRYSRGDTIIEVLLAITIFSMVAVASITLMNQGTSASQRALEITLVRQQIDAQAESLRAAHQAYTAQPTSDAEWVKVVNKASTGTFNTEDGCPTAAQLPSRFAMNPSTASIINSASWFTPMLAPTAPPYAQVQTSAPGKSYGIWIEAAKNGLLEPKAYDFRIRACWYGAGLSTRAPMQLETLVRLYDPS
ncbi:hypothetical protein KBD87_03025 [Candidatus Saccharibacteria bacterium]|jgi:type II secretory pathway pseudopilin PulG|nr:hypothetical protein [Candidatus Saccharibacteria bacterium]